MIGPITSTETHLILAAATPEVCNDLFAFEKGEGAYLASQKERLEKGENFYDTIKKINLKSVGHAPP